MGALREVSPVPSPSKPPAVDQVESAVIRIVQQAMGTPAPVTRESTLLGDLGFDSLRVLELVGELEDHFSIAVPLNALTHVKTVGDVAVEVQRLLPSQEFCQ